MDTKTTGDWIMYYEVQRLQREGVSYRAIAKTLVMNRRTVIKYLAMSEAEYQGFLQKNDSRGKLFLPSNVSSQALCFGQGPCLLRSNM